MGPCGATPSTACGGSGDEAPRARGEAPRSKAVPVLRSDATNEYLLAWEAAAKVPGLLAVHGEGVPVRKPDAADYALAAIILFLLLAFVLPALLLQIGGC